MGTHSDMYDSLRGGRGGGGVERQTCADCHCQWQCWCQQRPLGAVNKILKDRQWARMEPEGVPGESTSWGSGRERVPPAAESLVRAKQHSTARLVAAT